MTKDSWKFRTNPEKFLQVWVFWPFFRSWGRSDLSLLCLFAVYRTTRLKDLQIRRLTHLILSLTPLFTLGMKTFRFCIDTMLPLSTTWPTLTSNNPVNCLTDFYSSQPSHPSNDGSSLSSILVQQLLLRDLSTGCVMLPPSLLGLWASHHSQFHSSAF